MTVRMESIRARVRDVFLGSLQPAEGGAGWGIATPATLAKREQEVNPAQSEAVDGLQRLVERAWFEPELETLEDVHAAERLDERRKGCA